METPHLLADNLEHEPDDPALPELLHALALARGTFALFIASCDDLLWRDECVRRLAAKVPGTLTVSLTEKTEDPFHAIPPAVAGTSAIHLLRLELTTPADESRLTALYSLNLRRGQWSALRCPLILWVPEYLLGLLLRHAPDFSDWRSGTYAFRAPAARRKAIQETIFHADMLNRATTFGPGAFLELIAERRRERSEELLARLQHLVNEDTPVLTSPYEAKWCLELAVFAALDNDSARCRQWAKPAISYSIKMSGLRGAASFVTLIGTAWLTAGNPQLAREAGEETWDMLNSPAAPPSEDKTLLADRLRCLALLREACHEQGDHEAGWRWDEQYAAAARRFLQDTPGDTLALGQLFKSLNSLADKAERAGEPETARALRAEWRQEVSALLAGDGDSSKTLELLYALASHEANRSFAAGELNAARQHQVLAVATLEKLIRLDPANKSRDEQLQSSLYTLGAIAMFAGDTLAAEEAHLKSHAIAVRLVAEDPGNAPRQSRLFESLLALADTGHLRGDNEAVAAHDKAAFHILEEKKRRGLSLDETESGVWSLLAPLFANPPEK